MKKTILTLYIGTLLCSSPSWAYMDIANMIDCHHEAYRTLPDGYSVINEIYGLEGPNLCYKGYYCNDQTLTCLKTSLCTYYDCRKNGWVGLELMESAAEPCTSIGLGGEGGALVCVPDNDGAWRHNCSGYGYSDWYTRDDAPSNAIKEYRICSPNNDGTYWVTAFAATCAWGYYGQNIWQDTYGKPPILNCTPCPYSNTDNITSTPGSSTITQCYATGGKDETGTYSYSQDCYYQQ